MPSSSNDLNKINFDVKLIFSENRKNFYKNNKTTKSWIFVENKILLIRNKIAFYLNNLNLFLI